MACVCNAEDARNVFWGLWAALATSVWGAMVTETTSTLAKEQNCDEYSMLNDH